MKANTAPSGVGLRGDRRHLVDHVVQLGNRIVPGGRSGSTSVLNAVRCPRSAGSTQTMIHGSNAAHTSRACSVSVRGAGGFGMVAAESSRLRKRRRRPELLRLPDLEEDDQAGHRDQRRADVDDPGIDEVRDQELRDRERHAGDQDRRPDLLACRASRRRPRSARTARSARRTAIAARPSRRGDRDRGRSRSTSPAIGVPSAP